MPRSFSETVYTRLLDGEHLKLSGVSRSEYESLRVALYRNHTPLKELGGVADELAVIASYSAESQEAFFRLGIPTRGRRKEFTIESIKDNA